MAAEQYANLGATALTANYTAGDASITVTSTAGKFPAAAPFRVYIADASDGHIKVILKVTAITDGTHFATSPEGTDANAASGDGVAISLTAGAMDAIRSDISQVGVYASLPSSGMKKGDRYRLTDGLYDFIYDGTNWLAFFQGFPAVRPDQVSFSWRNQNGASVANFAGATLLKLPASVSTAQITGREIAAPSTPYTITCCQLRATYNASGQNSNSGMYFADNGSGKIVYFYITGDNIPYVQTWNSASSFSAQPYDGNNTQARVNPVWFQVTDDGTNFTFSWSADGINFIPLYNPSRTAFLTTPDRVGFAIMTANNNFIQQYSLMSWKQS